MGRIQRPYALLLVRALLLGVQLSPILFAADVVLTESCRFMCTCFEFVGLHDTTWLDTVVSCTVDLSLDALASRGSSRRSLAPKHECNAFYNAILTPQHLDAHLLLLLAGGATSLVCWCTLFAFLAWLGAVKARLLRRIISRRWWRAKRALLHQPNNGMVFVGLGSRTADTHTGGPKETQPRKYNQEHQSRHPPHPHPESMANLGSACPHGAMVRRMVDPAGG